MTEMNSTEESFDLLNWIENGSSSAWETTIYHDLKLANQMQKLDDQYRAAEVAELQGGESLGTRKETKRILAEMESLMERWDKSKTVWAGRGLASEEIEDISAKYENKVVHPEPRRTQFSTEKAYLASYQAWAAAQQEVEEHNAKMQEKRNLEFIAMATETVTSAKGVQVGVKVEHLKALKNRPQGQQAILTLLNAVNRATTGNDSVELPKLLALSESTQD